MYHTFLHPEKGKLDHLDLLENRFPEGGCNYWVNKCIKMADKKNDKESILSPIFEYLVCPMGHGNLIYYFIITDFEKK